MLAFPNAKINLGLNVIEQRTDGFHNISSCFYPINWHDVIEIVESDKFSFEISGINIPGNQNDNLCVKAYRLLKKDFQLPEVSIQLHKIIPVGAGLGGGSSDASSVLKVINTLFNLFLSDEILGVYAEQLGSDCPFFIGNKSVIAESKGEELKPIHIDLNNYQIVIIHPGLIIDTATAYKNIRPSQPQIPVRKIIETFPIETWKDSLQNDFEPTVFKIYPEIDKIKKTLYDKGVLYASMTGSGSSVFGIFKSGIDLEELKVKYTVWTGEL